MKIFLSVLFCLPLLLWAQKKPLDHSVYDKWQSISERSISNDGKWVAYIEAVQEGDDACYVVALDGSRKYQVPRGYSVRFNKNASHAVMLVKPAYSATREARIRKKKPEDMPKDSLAIIELATGQIRKVPNVRSYGFPADAPAPLAYLLHKAVDTSRKTPADADEGADLVIEHLSDTLVRKAGNVSEYKWNPRGRLLVMESRANAGNKGSVNAVVIYRTVENRFDTILKGGNDFANFATDSIGYQVAFTAERDSSKKSLIKTHKLWYWKNGMDTAVILAEKNSTGMKLGWTVSEHRELRFSGSGNRLFFGTAQIRPAKDTSVPEIDRVKVDVWHWNDDYLQTRQLFDLSNELKRSYLALYDLSQKKLVQLADEGMKDIITTRSGDGELFIGLSDTGRRVQSQWTGSVLRDYYAVNPSTGGKTLVKKNSKDLPQLSPAGNYISWYDSGLKQYFTWKNGNTVNVSSKIPFKLYDEDFDMPDDPNPYARMRWLRDDKGLLVEDRYDVWKLDPDGRRAPVNITKGIGRKNRVDYSYIQPQTEEEDPGAQLLLTGMDEKTKDMGLYRTDTSGKADPSNLVQGPFLLTQLVNADDASVIGYTRQSFTRSPDLYVLDMDKGSERKLTALNPQQEQYNWGTAELVKWKAYDGREAEGLIFKPEDFRQGKRYPMICYFYERNSETLHAYRAPAPVPSRLDVSFFVSRGYIVFIPDIRYRTGYPGKGAFDYVVSGAREMVRRGWVDSTKIGIQGQSWGGYQVCHLITRTRLFAAAWAGAPVANMTSAYGGIRWESGVNRQFQYEKSQSRIGATLWEKPQLYIENSPLFHLPKVSTPLVIMSNDEDGAVPWYQGIELFTAMRRLGKKVWLLNYNGEKHNLVERKNRKDLSVREQEFFDWMLKGEKPARWLAEGVPATEKN